MVLMIGLYCSYCLHVVVLSVVVLLMWLLLFVLLVGMFCFVCVFLFCSCALRC